VARPHNGGRAICGSAIAKYHAEALEFLKKLSAYDRTAEYATPDQSCYMDEHASRILVAADCPCWPDGVIAAVRTYNLSTAEGEVIEAFRVCC